MSKSFLRLADFILDSYISTALMTATEIAHEVNIDAATVVRFAQTLGYSGFPELHKEIKARVKKEFTVKSTETSESPSAEILIRDFGEYLVSVFSKTDQFVLAQSLVNFSKAVSDCDQVTFLINPEWISIINQIKKTLELSGKNTSVIKSTDDDLAIKLINTKSYELVLCLDIDQDLPIYSHALTELNKNGITTCAVVGAPSFGVFETADITFSLPGNVSDAKKPLIIFALIQLINESIEMEFEDEILDWQDKLASMNEKLFTEA